MCHWVSDLTISSFNSCGRQKNRTRSCCRPRPEWFQQKKIKFRKSSCLETCYVRVMNLLLLSGTHTHTNLLTPDMAVVFLNKENMAQYSVILTFHTAFAVGKRRPQLSKLLKYDSNKCFLFFF